MEDKKILERFEKKIKDECTICYTNIKPNDSIILKCSHIFHRQCLKKWFDVQKKNVHFAIQFLISKIIFDEKKLNIFLVFKFFMK